MKSFSIGEKRYFKREVWHTLGYPLAFLFFIFLFNRLGLIDEAWKSGLNWLALIQVLAGLVTLWASFYLVKHPGYLKKLLRGI